MVYFIMQSVLCHYFILVQLNTITHFCTNHTILLTYIYFFKYKLFNLNILVIWEVFGDWITQIKCNMYFLWGLNYISLVGSKNDVQLHKRRLNMRQSIHSHTHREIYLTKTKVWFIIYILYIIRIIIVYYYYDLLLNNSKRTHIVFIHFTSKSYMQINIYYRNSSNIVTISVMWNGIVINNI